ncbi:methyltransferase domain-containing protein [Polynucleobacter sp. AP-Jannik-300A-C4]|nr:methyltransferase domain-containing protein [Polynucleobacter sp. AP-Jannik-300A-C4]
MKDSLLDILCCPHCHSSLMISGAEYTAQNYIISGLLVCTQCQLKYPILHGVPLFSAESLESDITANNFSGQWDMRRRGFFESNEVFGFNPTEYLENFKYSFQIQDVNLPGEFILEAGVGSGVLFLELAKKSPQSHIIGVDIASTVFFLESNVRHYENAHIIQADIALLPLKSLRIDKIYSSGVIHHTANMRNSLAELYRLLKKRGSLFFWIYPAYIFCAYDALRKILYRPYKWRRSTRLCFSWLMAPAMFLFFFITGKYSYKNNLENFQTIAFRIFDNISPEFQHRSTADEILTLCHEVGIDDPLKINDLGVLCVKK